MKALIKAILFQRYFCHQNLYVPLILLQLWCVSSSAILIYIPRCVSYVVFLLPLLVEFEWHIFWIVILDYLFNAARKHQQRTCYGRCSLIRKRTGVSFSATSTLYFTLYLPLINPDWFEKRSGVSSHTT